MPSQSKILSLLNDIQGKLDQLSEKVEQLDQQRTSQLKDCALEYPNAFLSPKSVLPYFDDIRSVQGVYIACRSGKFKLGPEMIDTSPPGSERPTYLINPYAYFKRVSEEQTPS